MRGLFANEMDLPTTPQKKLKDRGEPLTSDHDDINFIESSSYCMIHSQRQLKIVSSENKSRKRGREVLTK